MADYDSASIQVDTQTILECTDALMAQAQEVVDDLTGINNQLSALALGWAGTTSDEVQEINDNWTKVMGELFGSQDNPESGCINAIISGLMQVAVGYSATEWQLASMWENFYTGLTSAAASGGSGGIPSSIGGSQSVIDPSVSAVQEIFFG